MSPMHKWEMSAMHEWGINATHEWVMSMMHKCDIFNVVYNCNAWIINKCNGVTVDECNTWIKNTLMQREKIIMHELEKEGWDVWYMHVPLC